MADQTPTPLHEITDETINTMVAFVEAAEVLAAPMGISVSQAYRFMLETGRAMTRISSGKFHLPSLPKEAIKPIHVFRIASQPFWEAMFTVLKHSSLPTHKHTHTQKK